ncbi:MAG TPA: hypothetical protein VN577_20490 [Terriglobales bacterium]|nr:hypothetical protein [Terriglobales bacterium]
MAAGTSCSRLGLKDKTPKFDTPYQVVILSNGEVLIGKLEGLDTEYPVLREAFAVSIVPAGDPNNPSKTTNMLISRSRVPNAPAYTVINARNISLIEPVTPGSTMDQLLAKEKAAASQAK